MKEKEKECKDGYHKVILNVPDGTGYKQECWGCHKVIGYTPKKVEYPMGYDEGEIYE